MRLKMRDEGRVRGSRFKVQGSRFWACPPSGGFWVLLLVINYWLFIYCDCERFKVQGLRFKVQSSRLRVLHY